MWMCKCQSNRISVYELITLMEISIRSIEILGVTVIERNVHIFLFEMIYTT